MKDEIKLSGVLSKGYGLSPKLVMTDTNLSIEAKAIYSYLSSFCGNGTTAFPSVDLIKHHLGIGKNRFYKYRKELVDRGYIKVIRRREGQKAISNLYKLNLELPQFEDIQNEDIDFEDIQNEDTNNNSLNNNSSKKDIVGKPDNMPYKPIINYLNNKIGTNYRYTSKKSQQLIKARINEGFTESDFYIVIDKKVTEWKGTDMDKFIRPETLFGPKFESYLNQKDSTNKKQTSTIDSYDPYANLPRYGG